MRILKSNETIKEEVDRDIRDEDKSNSKNKFWLVMLFFSIPWVIGICYMIKYWL